MIPFVFDINRSSTADGPGIRTSFFFKGCNLDCKWCHNPESKSPAPELALFSEKCIGCGMCKRICRSREECISCGECTAMCPQGARTLYGHRYTAEELYSIAAEDLDFFRASGGGVTFSGGECMLYPSFLAELSRRCVLGGIDVAIDTAGHVPWSHFEAVLSYVSCFLYDIKAIDPALHKLGTGADNYLILDNLEKLIRTGKKIIIRTPVIPEYNDGAELERIISYCAKRGLRHELLPYHSIGENKKLALYAAKKSK